MPRGIKKAVTTPSAKTKAAPATKAKALPASKATGASVAKIKTAFSKSTAAKRLAGSKAFAGKSTAFKAATTPKGKTSASAKPAAAGQQATKIGPASKAQTKTASTTLQPAMSAEQSAKHITSLEQKNSALRAKNRELGKTVGSMTAQIADLEAANAKHEQKAKRMNAANAKARSASKALADAGSGTEESVVESEGGTDHVTVSGGDNMTEFTPMEDVLDHSA